MFPTDLAIFSPVSWIMPLCIQIRASSLPGCAARVWAASFSWWGNTRSEPPPWMSMPTPSRLSAIRERSLCQPGGPDPHPLAHSRETAMREAAVAGARAHAEVDVAVGRIGMPGLDQRVDVG